MTGFGFLFDEYKPDHLEAYIYYAKHRKWPEGFVLGNIYPQLSGEEEFDVLGKCASAWLNNYKRCKGY